MANFVDGIDEHLFSCLTDLEFWQTPKDRQLWEKKLGNGNVLVWDFRSENTKGSFYVRLSTGGHLSRDESFKLLEYVVVRENQKEHGSGFEEGSQRSLVPSVDGKEEETMDEEKQQKVQEPIKVENIQKAEEAPVDKADDEASSGSEGQSREQKQDGSLYQKKEQPLPSGLSDKKWRRVETDEDAEVIKLQIGGFIEGLLVDRFTSSKYNNAGVYKIKVKGDEKLKVILGTTLLDKQMANITINTEIAIVRHEDTKNAKGQNVQQYDVLFT